MSLQATLMLKITQPKLFLLTAVEKTTTRYEYEYNAQNFPISVKAYVKENDNSEKLVSEAQLEYGS